MIRLIRSVLLLAIIGLLAASAITWKPLPQDGSQPAGNTPANQLALALDRWSEKFPTLKNDIQSLREDIQSRLVEWKETASSQTELIPDIPWDQFKVSEESKESFTTMLLQLKEQLKHVNMEDLTAKVQELIGKAQALPETSPSTDGTQPE